MSASNSMSRRSMLALLASISAASVLRPAQAATKLVLSSGYPDNSQMVRNNRAFAEALNSRLSGKVQAEVYGNAALYKVPETKRAVQTGQVQMGEIFLAGLANENPIFALDGLPFLATTLDQAGALWQVQRPYVEKLFDEAGLKLLFGVAWPAQSLFSNKPLNTFSDLAGTKFRIQNPTTARLAELMKVTGVRVETADLPQAFLTGIIQGMYTSNATGAGAASWDYCKYIYETNAWYPKNVTFINKRVFEKMPEAIQAVILEEAAVAEKRGWAMEQEETAKANALLREHGVQVLPPPEDLMSQFRKIGDIMTEEWLASAGSDGKAAIAEYRKLTA